MISGFNVDIPSDDLRAHLAARAAHHTERARWYEEQQAQFNTAISTSATNDPVAAMKEAGKRHAEKASWFSFVAAHIPAGEVYRLPDHDLARLELVASKNYG